ncbi:kinase [Clostridium acetobutylicum]|nr:kinase [Clostridium acetobutylicum]
MKISAKYPASVGEVVQGSFNGKDVLMSFPVSLFTEVTLFERKASKDKYNNLKTMRFLENILNRWGFEKYINNIDISISSNIPRGKGFASSTADLCALYYALLRFFGREFNERELIEECINIEPTDSIIFDKATVFDYKEGSYKKTLGEYPKLHILVFEGKRIIDTVSFNKKELKPLKDVGNLIKKVEKALKVGSVKDIGEAATLSIVKNCDRLSYDILGKVLRLKDETCGIGIIGAHSGDMLGIIYDDKYALDSAKEKVENIKNYKIYELETLLGAEMRRGIYK